MTAGMTYLGHNTLLNSKASRKPVASNPAVTGFLLVLLVTVAFCTGWGQIEALSPLEGRVRGTFTFLPGKVASIAIALTNRENANLQCVSFVHLPNGWRHIVGIEAFDMNPLSRLNRIISFSIPPDTPPGENRIAYKVRSARDGKLLLELEASVIILPNFSINLSPMDVPRYSVAGSVYSSIFLLVNNSNEAAWVQLRARDFSSQPLTVDSNEVHLLPGEQRKIVVSVTTDSDSRAQFLDYLQLQAVLLTDTAITARASSIVSILPAVTMTAASKLPLQFAFRSTGDNSYGGSQVELHSRASSPVNKEHSYEILLRGPNNQTKSLLGERDEYRAIYEADFFELGVGDQTFSLTPLTELGRHALGAKSTFTIGQLRIGTFANRARRTPSKHEEVAGFATYVIDEGSSVGVNYLQKLEIGTTNIFTLQTNLKDFKAVDFAVELGASRSEGRTGNALAIEVGSRSEFIHYGLKHLYGDADFKGYYRDLNATSLTVALLPWRQARIEGSFRDELRNLDKTISLLHAPHEREYQIGVGYGSHAAVFGRWTKQNDRLGNPKYDADETAFLLRLGLGFKTSSLTAGIDLGNTHDNISHIFTPFRRLSLAAGLRPNADQNYTVSFEYGSRKDLFTHDLREGATHSIGAWYRIGPTLLAQIGLHSSSTISPVSQTNLIIDIEANYTLPFGHRINVLGRSNIITGLFDQRGFAYSLEYVVPVDLSVSRGGGTCLLTGRIVDMESGRGIPDVVVYAGEIVAVSDQEGIFRFTNLKEDTHSITLDGGTIGTERTTIQILPLRVALLRGQNRHVEIGITRSGSISGRVFHSGNDSPLPPGLSPSDKADSVSLVGVPVELRSETEVFRRLTDANGRFRFSHLRPGKWTVSVLETEATDGLAIGRGPQLVVLGPGQHSNVIFSLQAKRRHVRMIEQGGQLRQNRR